MGSKVLTLIDENGKEISEFSEGELSKGGLAIPGLYLGKDKLKQKIKENSGFPLTDTIYRSEVLLRDTFVDFLKSMSR